MEHVLTSDSDSDCETDKRASTTTTKTDDQDPEDEHEHEHEQGATSSAQRASVDAVPHPDVEHTSATTRNVNTCADSPVVAARARAPLTPTTTFASGGGGVSALAATAAMPISPVVEANSPPAESEPAAAAPAVAAASVAQHADDDGGAAYAGSETETETGVTKTIPGDEGDEGDEGESEENMVRLLASQVDAWCGAASKVARGSGETVRVVFSSEEHGSYCCRCCCVVCS